MVETECAGKAICFTAGIKESGLRFIRGSFVLVLHIPFPPSTCTSPF